MSLICPLIAFKNSGACFRLISGGFTPVGDQSYLIWLPSFHPMVVDCVTSDHRIELRNGGKLCVTQHFD